MVYPCVFVWRNFYQLFRACVYKVYTRPRFSSSLESRLVNYSSEYNIARYLSYLVQYRTLIIWLGNFPRFRKWVCPLNAHARAAVMETGLFIFCACADNHVTLLFIKVGGSRRGLSISYPACRGGWTRVISSHYYTLKPSLFDPAESTFYLTLPFLLVYLSCIISPVGLWVVVV